MLTDDIKRVSILNRQIQVNNDRVEGYAKASAKTDIEVLKVLFSRLGETSIRCKEDLCKEVYKLGGVPETGTALLADFPKAWKQIELSINGNNHKAILDACYLEEFMSVKSYEYALRYYNGLLTTQHSRLFVRQRELLKEDQQRVTNLRQLLVKS